MASLIDVASLFWARLDNNQELHIASRFIVGQLHEDDCLCNFHLLVYSPVPGNTSEYIQFNLFYYVTEHFRYTNNTLHMSHTLFTVSESLVYVILNLMTTRMYRLRVNSLLRKKRLRSHIK